jgi:hypothetical protein
VNIDTQGFDGSVVRGMQRLLQQKSVQYILFELWPTAMKRSISCEETLSFLLANKYVLFETGFKSFNNERRPTAASWISHPKDVSSLCKWYIENSQDFGLWTDILAVASIDYN